MTQSKDHYELLVIGGGPAGITLSRRLGKKMRMGVVRPEPHSMIYCAMPYAIEGLLPVEKTWKKDELVTGSGADLIRDSVTKIDFENKEVLLESGRRIRWDKLVIATGAEPFIPPVPGHDLPGVMGFKTGDDLDRIMSLLKSGVRDAVVVGAGAIGVELSQALHHAGCNTTVVEMQDAILPNMLDPDFSDPARQAMEEHGIRLLLGRKVTEIRGNGCAQEVILDNGETIRFPERANGLPGLVLFVTGVRPNLDLLKDSPVLCGRDGILVNARMETNVPDVYACGDVVQFHSGITGRATSGKLATNAVPMAKALARNLSGQPWTYPGFFNGAATKVYDWYLGGVGLTSRAAEREGYTFVVGEGETTTRFPVMPDAKPLKVRLLAERKTGRILGGQIISGEPVCARIDVITLAIQNEAPVHRLIDLSYCSQPYQAFFPANNAVVAAAEDCLAKL